MLMRMMNTGEADLLAALHDGLSDQPLWSRFLGLLQGATGAATASLIVRPKEGPAVHFHAGDSLPLALQEYFTRDDDAARLLREGRVYAWDELTAADQGVPTLATLEEFGFRHLRTLRLADANDAHAWLTIAGPRDMGAASAALLSRLGPHLKIALNNLAALERERRRASISSEMIGRLNFGWLTIDARCRIIDQSANVQDILRRTALLRHGRYDRLTFASAAIDRDVAALAKAFAQDPHIRPRAFRLSQDPWMDMFVTAIPDRQPSEASPAVAMLYLSGDRWSRDDRCEQLIDLFGLLPSEARLAWAMAQGRSIAEAAHDLGLTTETARNYSKKIYAKTGAGGQADLVRIIFTSVLAII